MTSGSCACHYIRYTSTSTPTRLVNCHCTTCRKQAGAPYQAFVHFPIGAIKWEVEPTTWKSSETASRTFCPKCGSTMSMVLDAEPHQIGIVAGTVDDASQIPEPSDHIFLEEKVPWYGLPADGTGRWQAWSQ
ncbi:hypothetical protein N7478_002931 [Penicillium angulare]|uniref:uncharacterized protein n=1 Tax=Penicillium angulare TaxID=116970 RepID=UPI002542140A|nr:uncharacterized protein N7478_002931 [Penicillium angulare]KAJ5287245.1 hypothetical protein N7478_002931 [Penicillium angulare]